MDTNLKLRAIVIDQVDQFLIDELSNRNIEVSYMPGIDRPGLLKEIENYDILVGRSRMPVDKEMINSGKRLKIIGRAGIGIDNIDVTAAGERGIIIANAPGEATESVAELALCFMIMASRNIFNNMKIVKEDLYMKGEMTSELSGKTIGIIGFGRIGTRVAELCKATNAKIIVTDILDLKSKAANLGAEFVSFDELLKRSDIITIHVNIEINAIPVLNRRAFGLMKKGVVLVNTARGKVVELRALYDGINSGNVGFYAADVLWNEPPKDEIEKAIIKKENVIVTAHIGAQTKEAQRRVAVTTVKNILDAVDRLK